MMYILDQRLRAQNIPKEKSRKGRLYQVHMSRSPGSSPYRKGLYRATVVNLNIQGAKFFACK